VTSAKDPPPDGEGAWPIRLAASRLHGRGVFATRDIAADEVVEAAPIILVTEEDWSYLEQTELGAYLYDIGDGRAAVAGGLASFYNHDSPANARYQADPDTQVVTVEAVRDIAADEEICINYNGDPDSTDPVWFGEEA
jgi:uncharacterized protein